MRKQGLRFRNLPKVTQPKWQELGIKAREGGSSCYAVHYARAACHRNKSLRGGPLYCSDWSRTKCVKRRFCRRVLGIQWIELLKFLNNCLTGWILGKVQKLRAASSLPFLGATCVSTGVTHCWAKVLKQMALRSWARAPTSNRELASIFPFLIC